MSVEENKTQNFNLLEELKKQHAQFIQQRDASQNNINQLIGAIYACELMIQKHEEENKKLLVNCDKQPEWHPYINGGDNSYVRVDNQTKE